MRATFTGVGPEAEAATIFRKALEPMLKHNSENRLKVKEALGLLNVP